MRHQTQSCSSPRQEVGDDYHHNEVAEVVQQRNDDHSVLEDLVAHQIENLQAKEEGIKPANQVCAFRVELKLGAVLNSLSQKKGCVTVQN